MRSLRSVVVFAVFACGMLGSARAGTILSTDPLVPAGLSEGDSFRFVFVTTDTITGTSGNIADYNNFVQSQAAALTSLVKDYGWVWSAIASVTNGTTITTAKQNTGTSPAGSGVLPIYRLDGVKVVNDYTELWTPISEDPTNSLLQNPISVSQAGDGLDVIVWTGSQGDGSALYGDIPLGPNAYGTAGFGQSVTTNYWVYASEEPLTSSLSLYAMSEVLTVVPEGNPGGLGSVLALVVGSFGMHRARRRVRPTAG